MVAEVLIAVVAVVIVFEVFEHAIILLIGVRAGRRRQPLTGAEGMVGKVVEVRRWSGAKARCRSTASCGKPKAETPWRPATKRPSSRSAI